MVLPALIAGGASLIGSALASRGQSSANRTNQNISQKQMDFQERMSSTAYQRSMEDMRKAGLNPILAYKMGGADTPIGASIPVQNEMAAFAPNLTQGVSAAMDSMKTSRQLSQIDQQIELMASQVGMNEETTQRIKEETARITTDIERIDAQTAGIQADNAKKEALANFIRSNPNAAIVSEYGGQGIVPLTTILGALGLDDLTDFALNLIDRMKENAPTFNINNSQTTGDGRVRSRGSQYD